MKKLKAAGEPFPVAQPIASGTNAGWLASSSWNGVLAYVSGEQRHWQYVWRDTQGRDIGSVGDAGDAGGVVMISPDGKRVVGDPGGAITLFDLARNTTTRLTVGLSRGMNPVWSPDGRYVAYNAPQGVYRKSTAGGAPQEFCPVRHPCLTFPRAGHPTAAT